MSIGLEVFMGCYVSKYASKLVFGIVATVWYGRNMKLRQLIMKLKIGKWFVALFRWKLNLNWLFNEKFV